MKTNDRKWWLDFLRQLKKPLWKTIIFNDKPKPDWPPPEFTSASGKKVSWETPQIEHGKPTKWGWMVLHPQGLEMPYPADIGAFTLIQAQAGVSIGVGVQIGSHCSIYSVSTIDGKRGPVVIGHGVKIGTHSVVMPGATIGAGATVGACSFVNRDIPEGEVWFGIPARRQDA